MSDLYILNEAGEPERCHDALTWGTWLESSEDARRVRYDELGDVRVSTIFLGADHSFGEGPPILYETMIFGGSHDQDQWRYRTRDEAVEGHQKAVELARAVGAAPQRTDE